MKTKRVWSKKQAHQYLRRVCLQLRCSWTIRFRYSKKMPKWVRGDNEALGSMCLDAPEQRVALIWIRPSQSIQETKMAVVHECLHVLFASARIDCTTLRGLLQQVASHQIVETLGDLLVKGLR